MPVAMRRSWAERVMGELNNILVSDDRVIFLAGAVYREFLIEHIKKMGCVIEIPMENLAIGEQLSWLNHRMGLSDGK